MIFLIKLTLTTVVITLIMYEVEELKWEWWGRSGQRIRKPHAGSSVKIIYVKIEKCLQANSTRSKQSTCRNKDFKSTDREMLDCNQLHEPNEHVLK